MKDGDKVRLVPGISKVKMTGSSAHRNRVSDTLKAMSEEVTIISLYNGTGNSKVRDKYDKVFYCNPDDLNELFEEVFFGK